MILENLRTAGVQQAHKEDRITFTALTLRPGEGSVCAEARYLEAETEKRAGIFIAPEFGTVQRSDLVEAARECGDAGFDPAQAAIRNWGRRIRSMASNSVKYRTSRWAWLPPMR